MKNPNRVLALVVAAIAVFAVIAAVVATTRSEPDIDPTRPEGVVQAYLRAALTNDGEGAIELVDPVSGCEVSDVRNAHTNEEVRVVVIDTFIDGEEATVEVEIIESSGGSPFDTYEFSHEEVFDLERSGGSWQITGQPWPLFNCGGR